MFIPEKQGRKTPLADAREPAPDLHQEQQSLMQDVLKLLLMEHLEPLP
jgi:hypothetical protein